MCQVVLRPGHVVCERCRSTLRPVPPLRCREGKARQLVVHAVSAYQYPLQQLVVAKRWRQQGAAAQLGQLAAQYLEQQKLSYDLIIPVPQHWRRYAWRGYNQAAVMAAQIARIPGMRYVQPFARRRATPLQQLLSKDERQRNVRGAFGIKWYWSAASVKRLLTGKRVLLVDDVFTTGATLRALAAVVWQQKPLLVHAIVACRVV